MARLRQLKEKAHLFCLLPFTLTALRRVAAIGFFASLSGCNFALPIMYLIQGPPAINAKFDELRGDKVVVVCDADFPVLINFNSVDSQLAQKLGQHLHDAYPIRKIDVVSSGEVASWLDEHDDWTVAEIGKAFDADYVLYVNVESFSVFEEHSSTMYRGRATVAIRVHDMSKDGNVVYDATQESKYPIGQPVSIGDIRRPVFEQQYIDRLADEIGRHFYPYWPGDETANYGIIGE